MKDVRRKIVRNCLQFPLRNGFELSDDFLIISVEVYQTSSDFLLRTEAKSTESHTRKSSKKVLFARIYIIKLNGTKTITQTRSELLKLS